MNNFPFSTVQLALTWYFRKAWLRPPPQAKALPIIRIGSSPTNDDAGLVFRAHQGIKRALNRLPPRDFCIVAAEFDASHYKQVDLAERFGLAGGDRSVRFIRDRSLKRIEEELMKSNIISRGRIDEPKYARD